MPSGSVFLPVTLREDWEWHDLFFFIERWEIEVMLPIYIWGWMGFFFIFVRRPWRWTYLFSTEFTPRKSWTSFLLVHSLHIRKSRWYSSLVVSRLSHPLTSARPDVCVKEIELLAVKVWVFWVKFYYVRWCHHKKGLKRSLRVVFFKWRLRMWGSQTKHGGKVGW